MLFSFFFLVQFSLAQVVHYSLALTIKICIKYIFPEKHLRNYKFEDLLLNPIEVNYCNEIINLHYGMFNNNQELNQFQIILPKDIERLKSEIKDQLKNNISNVFIATNLIRGFYALTIKEIQANLYKKGFSYKDISKVIQTPYLCINSYK